MTVKQNIALAQAEIAAIFANETAALSTADDRNIGFRGDRIGICPKCGGEIVRGVYNYGCMKYKDGCKFRIPLSLCSRPIPVSAAVSLLETGKTEVLTGFVSKAGKQFAAALKIEGDDVKFDFSAVPRTPRAPVIFSSSSREVYENEELPPDFFAPPPDTE